MSVSKIPSFSFTRQVARHTNTSAIELLNKTLSDTGFVYLENTPITNNKIESLFKISKWFFKEVPMPVKRSINCFETGYRGYYEYIGNESLNNGIECFNIGKECDNPMLLRKEYYDMINNVNNTNNIKGKKTNNFLQKIELEAKLNRKNQWPMIENDISNCNQFKEIVCDYYDLCCQTSEQMLEYIAQSLNLDDKSYFTQFHDKWDCSLEIKYYKNNYNNTDNNTNNNNKNSNTILNEHCDLSSVTLLIQDKMAGLQVWSQSDQCWIDAPATIDDNRNNCALLCNTGNFMQMWTNGKYPSTLHRVKHNSDIDSDSDIDAEGRISIVFFCFPNHDAIMEPLSTCIGNAPVPMPFIGVCGDYMPFVY